MTISRLSSRLLKWYRLNQRTLPWRDPLRSDPYAVWVSEIMLQQTRVETVIPYFEKWMKLFPTVGALAAASEQDILNAWEGLGYYSRARNLHKAAQMVVEKYHGKIPRDLDNLRQLPGIGRYTLGAIASIAFDMNVPALDGNIKRVYARVFDVSQPVDSSTGEKILWDLAEKHLPNKEAGDYNQALMDLGATICIPKNPRCLICPLMKLCKAREHGTQHQRPVKLPKKEIPHHIHAAGVIIRRTLAPHDLPGKSSVGVGNPPHGEVLLAKRPSKGLLGGMWEFPNGQHVKRNPFAGLAGALKTGYNLRLRDVPQSARKAEPLGIVHHGYSHFSVSVYVYACKLESKPSGENLKWVPIRDLDEYPMGKIDRQIAHLVVG